MGGPRRRECPFGHLTSSALVVDVDRTRVLLTLHPKVGRWLQLGGHSDGEPDTLIAAKREAEEETVSIRRLGTKEQVSMTLEDAIRHMVDEGTPPDLLPAKAKATKAAE